MGYRSLSGRQKLWTFLNPLLKLTFSPRLSDLGETNVVFVCRLHVFVKLIFWILFTFTAVHDCREKVLHTVNKVHIYEKQTKKML